MTIASGVQMLIWAAEIFLDLLTVDFRIRDIYKAIRSRRYVISRVVQL